MDNTFIFQQAFAARKWPLAVLAGFFVLVLVLIDAKSPGEKAYMNMLWLILMVFILVFYAVLMRLKIIIDNSGLQMQTILKTEQLQWDEVVGSKLSFEFHGHTGDVNWLINRSNGKTFSFSPTFFSRDQLQQIATALVNKSSSAQISVKVQNMAQGRFPWYVF